MHFPVCRYCVVYERKYFSHSYLKYAVEVRECFPTTFYVATDFILLLFVSKSSN